MRPSGTRTASRWRWTCRRTCCTSDNPARSWLEQLCSYIKRPSLSEERVPLSAAWQAGQTVKTPWCEGATHLVMSPLDFMQRLAALVPRPRSHLIRFHGAMAPNAKLRSLVVPQRRSSKTGRSPKLLWPLWPQRANSSRSRPSLATSAGRRCSSACSTSTFGTARSATAGN
ncbi:MAG: transposase [Burkholderiaceae bacterium]|nr:transposase [Burkholderiaceae bacterium]